MPENPSEVSTLASELGWLLARTREERGLNIDTIATAVHMRKHYVQALESGRFDELPGATYVRGYLMRYAEFLELNTTTILGMYDRLEHAPARKFFALTGSLERNPYPEARLVVLCLLMAFVALLVWTNARDTTPTALVEPYAPFENLAHTRILPHRCEAEQPAYPPCFWENLALWYRPTESEKHIFVVTKSYEPTP